MECESNSELCRYVSVLQEIFRKVKKFFFADRDGN